MKIFRTARITACEVYNLDIDEQYIESMSNYIMFNWVPVNNISFPVITEELIQESLNYVECGIEMKHQELNEKYTCINRKLDARACIDDSELCDIIYDFVFYDLRTHMVDYDSDTNSVEYEYEFTN